MMKIILPIIFIFYAVSVSFFVHTHIENGVTIVHSHPYSTTDDGDVDHSHTRSEIQLIHNLNTFFATIAVIFSITISIFYKVKNIYFVKDKEDILSLHLKSCFKLRPPPIL